MHVLFAIIMTKIICICIAVELPLGGGTSTAMVFVIKSISNHYGSHFFRIFIFCEKRRICGDFSRKTKKKWKKILPKKIVKIGFALTNFFNFWLEKISRQGFSSFFAIFLKWILLERL